VEKRPQHKNLKILVPVIIVAVLGSIFGFAFFSTTPTPWQKYSFIKARGSSGFADGEFTNPFGVAIDSKDNVYVSDKGNNRIQKFTSDGKFITQWGSAGKGTGEFYGPAGIAVDSQNNVYISDHYNNRIQVFAPRV
jgi:tripartite motif-containing protein 71